MTVAKSLSIGIKNDSLWRDGAIVLLSSILIALCGKISMPLPFTPVPMAFQNSLVLALALFLGSRRGAAAVFCFLIQGAIGLPVLALGSAGLLTFLGPTGGYLIGYLVAAFATGYMGEKLPRKTLPLAFFALVAGNGIIYLFGAAYLSTLIGIKQAFMLGVVPFVVGDFFKLILTLKILQWIGWNKSSCR